MFDLRHSRYEATHGQQGVSTVEYAVMLVLVALAVAFFSGIDTALVDVFQRLTSIF